MTPYTFYLVWSPDGKTPPKKRYNNEQAAAEEAEKMALLFPSQSFYAMKSVAGRIGKVQIERVAHQ